MQRKLADRIVTIAICAMLAASATATPAAAQTPRWLSGLFGGRASTHRRTVITASGSSDIARRRTSRSSPESQSPTRPRFRSAARRSPSASG